MNVRRRPLKTCKHCKTRNEPDNTTCIGCGRKFE